MNRTAYIPLAAAAMIAATACSGHKTPTPVTDPEATAGLSTGNDSRTERYTGTLPAADVEGIRYDLTLQYDSDSTDTDGDFHLQQVYISDTNPATYHIHGDFEVLSGTPASPSQRYLRLISDPDADDAPADTLYLVVTTDSTLTLTGPDRLPAPSALDYTLHRLPS